MGQFAYQSKVLFQGSALYCQCWQHCTSGPEQYNSFQYEIDKGPQHLIFGGQKFPIPSSKNEDFLLKDCLYLKIYPLFSFSR
jgi:hypothetical protein